MFYKVAYKLYGLFAYVFELLCLHRSSQPVAERFVLLKHRKFGAGKCVVDIISVSFLLTLDQFLPNRDIISQPIYSIWGS